MSNTRKYVWDANDFDDNEIESVSHIDIQIKPSTGKLTMENSSSFEDYLSSQLKNITVSTDSPITKSKNIYSYSPNNKNLPTNSIEKAVNGLQSKIETLANEYKIISETCKSLQNELNRITSAKNRKYERLSLQWEEKVKISKEEFSNALTKQTEIENRLNDNIKELKNKLNDLNDKLETFNTAADENIQLALKECQRKINRAKRQWESDDKIALEKEFNKKSQALQKQAYDFHGPKMDELVKQLKESLAKRKQEKELSLESLESLLTMEAEKNVDNDIEKLKIELNEIEERKIKLNQQKLLDMESNRSDITQLKERHQLRMRELQDKYDQTRRIDNNSYIESNRSIKDLENQQIQELITNHQKNISIINQKHNQEILEISEKYQNDLLNYEKIFRDRSIRQQQLTENSLIEKEKQRIENEKENMLNKIKEDIQIERNNTLKLYEIEEENERIKYNEKKQILMKSFDSVSEHLTNLKEKLSNLQEKRILSDNELNNLKIELSDKLQLIDKLKINYKNLENESEILLKTTNESLEQCNINKANELKEWQLKLSNIEQSYQQLQLEHKNQLINEENNKKINLERIQGKINKLIAAKDHVINENKQNLYELIENCNILEQQLENEREKKISLDGQNYQHDNIRKSININEKDKDNKKNRKK